MVRNWVHKPGGDASVQVALELELVGPLAGDEVELVDVREVGMTRGSPDGVETVVHFDNGLAVQGFGLV